MSTVSLPEVAAPESLDDLLRASGALGGGRITDVAIVESRPTILSHIFRLRLSYAGVAGADSPTTLILKAGLPDRPGGPWSGGRHEVAFYRDVAPLMPGGIVPRCFDAQWESGTGTWHLLLEDLTDSHVVATHWPLPPTFEQCEIIVRTRARCQAAWWDDPRLGATVGSWQEPHADEAAVKVMMGHFSRFADEMGDRLSPERRRLYERLFEGAPRLMERYRTHRDMTIVQGDAHVWNCFLPRDGTRDGGRLFDWDGWQLNTGTDDLACMMAQQWYPDLRSRFEARLLDSFHDELTARGVKGFTREALQADYQLSVLWLLASPIWQHANNIPPVIWWNNFERVCLAVEDLGCRELL